MSFLRSLFSGVSALRNHQTMMDVIGNNIANVNTTGFKGGRTTFKELFAQTMTYASRPSQNNGGTNPMQVGLGMALNTLDTIFQQGNLETTGSSKDLAILGNGFFVVHRDDQTLYTRDGHFEFNSDGRLISPGTGAVLQGKLADSQGNVPPGTRLEDIVIQKDVKSPAKATTAVHYAGNLDSSAATYSAGPPASGGIANCSIGVYDSLGNEIPLDITFTKTGTNTWRWAASVTQAGSTPTSVGGGTMTFNSNGTLQAVSSTAVSIPSVVGASQLDITIDFGDISPTGTGVFAGVTQSSGNSSVALRSQDGYESGLLSDVSIDAGGRVLGTFTNGTVITLAQIMMAEFSNPAGLTRTGQNTYGMTGNSGAPSIFDPGNATKIVSGSLEQSNVDLAEEFTRMILAQRGFQASARVITTSDEFLQEVVNLKR